MTQEEFEKLLKPDQCQVFLLTCPPSLPLSFARHPWFVVNAKGTVSRYEVVASPKLYNHPSVGHLYVNALPPTMGLRVFRTARYFNWRWPSRFHGVIEGGEGSVAARMAEFLHRSPEAYHNIERYAYIGPNSNTYAQWVLSKFPESGLNLPWNSFGKEFR